MSMELKASVNEKETNFFILQKQIEAGRLQVLKNYPCMQLFLEKCNTETITEALSAIEEKKKELTDLYKSFDAQADFSRFSPDTDAVKLRKILHYTLKNLMEDHFLAGSFQTELLFEENIAYIEFLEKIFC